MLCHASHAVPLAQPICCSESMLPPTHPLLPIPASQVALGILPLTVIASWLMGKAFILDFDQFSVS